MSRLSSMSLRFLLITQLTITSSLIKPASSKGHQEYERMRRLYLTKDAPKNMFPFVVSIQLYDLNDFTFTHVCGGSILTKRWVLTAAHCLLKISPENLLIRYGSNTFEDSPNLIVNKVIFHPEFKTDNGIIKNDIALIKTKHDFLENWSPVQFIKKEIGLNKNVTVPGWVLDSSLNFDRTLKYGFMNTKKCPDDRHQYFICGQGARVVPTADSGGPMLFMNALVGVASFHITTDTWNGYFTDVNKYMYWIAEIMKTN